jgi:hypothetical protein
MTDSKKRNQRILIAVIAAISSVAIIVPLVSALLGMFGSGARNKADSQVTTTSTAPVYTIKPLVVRPVVSAFVTTPDQCPPRPPVPVRPDQPMRICDITKTAVYELQPEALKVQLTKVDSFVNPLTGVQTVEMSMTKDSAEKFATFTGGQVGKQIAFVRAGTVVWGPKIGGRIEGEVLQLSGDLKPEQAKEIARMLKDES